MFYDFAVITETQMAVNNPLVETEEDTATDFIGLRVLQNADKQKLRRVILARCGLLAGLCDGLDNLKA